MDKAWGLTVAEWTAVTAVAAVFYTILTLVLVVVAYTQIRSARAEARTNRTLNACEMARPKI